ncbi:hypothetical protein Taro_001618 [Colocasia esculenta]|uniref:Uncharacterized protein n=1 Tax=Colocasia esculenta TaxID=4460 RepID=A0A843TGC2_COLES|nr:hypothetical protein [Colocasia esculenta]
MDLRSRHRGCRFQERDIEPVAFSDFSAYDHEKCVQSPCAAFELTLPLLDACFAREWSGDGAKGGMKWRCSGVKRNELKSGHQGKETPILDE